MGHTVKRPSVAGSAGGVTNAVACAAYGRQGMSSERVRAEAPITPRCAVTPDIGLGYVLGRAAQR